MANERIFSVAVFPGDGIGPEVTAPCREVLARAVAKVGGVRLEFAEQPAGAAHYRETGEALPEAALEAARQADAILLAAMGLPDVRYPDGTEISPQLTLRFALGLYAGIRPVRSIPGIPPVLADERARDIDFVLIRESTEGLFASHGKGEVTDDREARDTLLITRGVSERLFDVALDLGAKRKAAGKPGRVTCVDKANVFTSYAFFRKVFDERAARRPDVESDHAYVDATALAMVRRPWDLDVMVTENMFGDILSDLGAGLIGGIGFAPSADVGDGHAVFQPCHGSAPDIAGRGTANPTAMFLSAAMMLEWLGERHDTPEAVEAGGLIRDAVDRAFAAGELLPGELGGAAGTAEIADRVLAGL